MSYKTFFITFGKTTRKFQGDDNDLVRLPQNFMKKFAKNPLVALASVSDVSFEMKDVEFDVVAKIDNYREIYDGAVVTAKINLQKTSGTAAQRAELKRLQSKLSTLLASGERAGSRYIIRMRGIPWESTKEDVTSFFSSLNIVENGIVMIERLGRPCGEAFVEFMTESDRDQALKRDRQNIGKRYIEVYRATTTEARGSGLGMDAGQKVPANKCPVSATACVVRMRGLPYSATAADVRKFLSDCECVAVHFPKDDMGRPSGQCYVELEDETARSLAIGHNKHNMGDRYIDIFESTVEDMVEKVNPAGAFPGQNRCVRMQGLPFNTSDQDIYRFYQGAGICPTLVHRRADGTEAYCEFSSETEASTAMGLNRQYIGSRYVELYLIPYNKMCNNMGINPQMGGMMNNGPPPSQYNPSPYMQGPGAAPGAPSMSYGGAPPMQQFNTPQGGGGGGYGSGGPTPGGYGAGGFVGTGGSTSGGFGSGGGGGSSGASCVVKMRGLPFRATKDEIERFFTGFDYLPGSVIICTQSSDGRPDGSAYITFGNWDAATRAVQQRNRQYLGGRYLELKIQQ